RDPARCVAWRRLLWSAADAIALPRVQAPSQSRAGSTWAPVPPLHPSRSRTTDSFSGEERPALVELGYKLCSEEHASNDLVRFARRAEEAGFDFAMISDHYHPWTDRQGQSPFVWTVLGAVAHATERLRIGTGVTCPTIRIHPAIVAQAAATTAAM